ncbi:MAG: tetratricopeptide repeat protein, partial [Candidatus Eisenbacteria sp.]|nr:tetratricopeptide repeat protein [Candidatus Eisenbacteria bacterium]
MPIREAAVTAGLDRTSRLARAAAVRRTCRSSVYITLAFLSVFYTGCAYFNTFYHAEQSYKKAQKVQRESKSEKLSPQAAKHYDDAIEKCGKVIKIHGGGWRAGIDDALYLMGVSYYGKKEYQTSIKTLNDLILRYRDSDHIPDALFYTGLCYHKMRNYATARRIFERLLRLHPDFHRRDEIMITAAEGLEAAGDEEGALYQYRAIVTGFNKSKQREEALERVGEICFEAGQYDSALVAYEELGRITRDDERYFEAQLRAGASLVRLGRHDDAMGVYERIMPENPDRDEQGGSVWLAMAEVENRRGNHEDAIEYLKRVSENFANRNMGLEADFRLGYAYEVHLKEYELAREAYQKTCGSRQRSVFKDQAAVRLKNLEHLEELQSSLEEEATDLDRKAEAALKMAEFTLFETADPRGALEQYTEVEESFPESPSAVNAAYARGWILRSELDSLDAAAAVFETLIERYPASRQAEFSLTFLEETGVPRERLEALTDLVHKER